MIYAKTNYNLIEPKTVLEKLAITECTRGRCGWFAPSPYNKKKGDGDVSKSELGSFCAEVVCSLWVLWLHYTIQKHAC